ncbi:MULTISPECIES: hypothetical protein [unclassified Mesorhizobium]|uniref:hypothetical protein n=1 Tax=unclassified Mesorhizobium TaxID=325217 RepID=UPI00112CCE30|nr:MULTISPECIES: hypothetical protein [unclassified Mesorhizobium]TPK89644.1 hypothetical protein FJ548_08910 [Mesorhizobium sp. B2-4-17]TPL06796.1 hypothetical protein FJ938_12300 [Mesorhizobium sp. B2-4-14]
MSDQSQTKSAETKTAQKRKVGRSPAYPYISVQKAVEKTKALYDREGEYAAPLESASAAWGYGAKSSGGRQTLATLKYYGLIDVQGENDKRKVKVSDVARRILLDQREDDTEKKQLLRKVALSPSAHKALYEQYPSGLASDGSVVHFLMFDLHFNRDAAAELLAEFKETARYIGLYGPDKTVDKNASEIHNAGTEKPPLDIKVGDKIQWSSQGVDQFPNGATVLGFSDDNQWAFTDQGMSGIPVREIKIMEPSPAQTPPAMPQHLADIVARSGQNTLAIEVKKGSRKAVFPVDEGDVTLIFPENMSADGLAELGQYLDIFLKKEQKKATP